MARSKRIVAGLCGPGVGGKTWLGRRICLAAGVDPDLALIETSKYITGLAERMRLRLIELAAASDLDDPRIPWDVMADISGWLAAESNGMLLVPQSAFELSRADPDGWKLLVGAIGAFRLQPENYREPITIDNKSTEINRKMLSGINVVTSRLAAAYLRERRGLQILSVWPWLAMQELELWFANFPQAPFGAICGLRLYGDDDDIRRRWRSPILHRQRYDESTAPLLYTEQGHLTPDLRVLGEPSVEGLMTFAELLWSRWSADPPCLPVPFGNQPIILGPMAPRP